MRDNSETTNMIDDITRALPHTLVAEKSVLSSILQDPREFLARAIEQKLTPDHFYLPSHRTLYEQFLSFADKIEEIELITLTQKLLDRGLLDRVGGPAAITDIYTYSPSGYRFDAHANMVKDKFVLRELIQTGNEIVHSAYESPDEPMESLDAAEMRVMGIRERTEARAEVDTKTILGEIAQEFQDLCEGKSRPQGLMTGFEGFDQRTNGMQPGDMIIIAGRPSMGKTAWAMNAVEHAAIDQGKKAMVFSLEMTKKQLLDRMVYSRAKFSSFGLKKGLKPIKAELQRIQRSFKDALDAPLIIDDTPGMSITELRSKARREHSKGKLSLIAVDYIQLMKSNSAQAKTNREREISEISSGLKAMAKELQLPVIVLAQLNRNSENRTGDDLGKPRMSDLRESGSLEQDADMVGLLYRPGYFDEDKSDEARQSVAKLILAKNRNGEVGTCDMTFIPNFLRFESGAPSNYTEPSTRAGQTGRFSK